MSNRNLGPDSDVELDCGCVAAIDHGQWSWDLTYTDDCTEGHTRSEAIEIADDVYV